MHRNYKGFSLVEVLVAAFILFLVLSTVTISYTGAVKGTLSATQSTKLFGYLPLLVEDIAFAVKNGEKSGNSHFLDIQYSWHLEPIESKEMASFYDNESFQDSSSGRVVYLQKVVLVTTYKGRTIDHSFKVVSWS
ncbi:MAG: hypothetical protein GJ680_19685 [Alteromonadaceae bacterium]|nr:hypothetical protein [Alteromonadaceae bacterium]